MDPLKFGFTSSTIVEEGRVKKDDIDYLTKWSVTQQLPKLTDEQAVLFLIKCTNDIEAAKSTIKSYFSIRNANPKLFTERDVDNEDLNKALTQTLDLFTTFEKRTENNFSILFARFNDTYYRNYDCIPCLKAVIMTVDAMIHANPPNGFIALLDMEGAGLMHLTRLEHSVLLPIFRYIQEALPTRLIAVHVLNTRPIINALMKVIKPFINGELIKKIHFHPPSLDMDYFYNNYINKSVIVEEYGGDLPPIKQLCAQTFNKLAEMKDHFKAEEWQRRDDS